MPRCNLPAPSLARFRQVGHSRHVEQVGAIAQSENGTGHDRLVPQAASVSAPLPVLLTCEGGQAARLEALEVREMAMGMKREI